MSYPNTAAESIDAALSLVGDFRQRRKTVGDGYCGIDPVVDAAEHAGHAAMLCAHEVGAPLAKGLRCASELLHGVARGLSQAGTASRLHWQCDKDLDEAERRLRNVREAF